MTGSQGLTLISLFVVSIFTTGHLGRSNTRAGCIFTDSDGFLTNECRVYLSGTFRMSTSQDLSLDVVSQ